MDFSSSIECVFEHVENDRVKQAVLACLRIAKAAQDHVNAAIFFRELYSTKQFNRTLAGNLNKDAIKYVDQKSLEIWIAERTLPFDLNDDDRCQDRNEKRKFCSLVSLNLKPRSRRFSGTSKT